MAEETVGYVMLEWVCKRCGARNPGTQKACAGCGAVISDKDQFQAPAAQQLITDANQLAMAQSGPDKHCKFCGAGNPAGAPSCGNCGADLREGHERAAMGQIGALNTGPVPDVACPFCKAMNPASARTCKGCNANLPFAQAPGTGAGAQAKAGASSGTRVGCAIAALVGLIVVVVLGVKCFSTKDAYAVVASTSWERSIAITEKREVTESDWADKIPSDARKGSCSKKVRRTQPEPAPDAEKVCDKPKMVDQGNGTAKVVQNCEYKIYDSWCEYTSLKWREVKREVARGSDASPAWPSPRLTSGQREGDRSETYKVVFKAGDKEYTYTPPSAGEYTRYSSGSKWNLKINGFGSVTDVTPPK